MKKKMIVALLCAGICLSGCSKIVKDFTKGFEEGVNEGLQQKNPQEQTDIKDKPETSYEIPEGMQRVGTAEFGYADVPEDWVQFKDVEGGTDFQYSDITGRNIITMNVFETDGLTEEQKASFDAMAAAQTVAYNMENDAVDTPLQLETATTTLGGYTAYQVYAAYEEGTMLVTWCFETEDGIVHYVAAEGAIDNIIEIVERIEATWSMSN